MCSQIIRKGHCCVALCYVGWKPGLDVRLNIEPNVYNLAGAPFVSNAGDNKKSDRKWTKMKLVSAQNVAEKFKDDIGLRRTLTR